MPLIYRHNNFNLEASAPFFIVFSEKIRGYPHPFLFLKVLVKNQQTVLVQEQF
jgi:hypothetical protein